MGVSHQQKGLLLGIMGIKHQQTMGVTMEYIYIEKYIVYI